MINRDQLAKDLAELISITKMELSEIETDLSNSGLPVSLAGDEIQFIKGSIKDLETKQVPLLNLAEKNLPAFKTSVQIYQNSIKQSLETITSKLDEAIVVRNLSQAVPGNIEPKKARNSLATIANKFGVFMSQQGYEDVNMEEGEPQVSKVKHKKIGNPLTTAFGSMLNVLVGGKKEKQAQTPAKEEEESFTNPNYTGPDSGSSTSTTTKPTIKKN